MGRLQWMSVFCWWPALCLIVFKFINVGLHLYTANVKASLRGFCYFLNRVGCTGQLCKV